MTILFELDLAELFPSFGEQKVSPFLEVQARKSDSIPPECQLTLFYARMNAHLGNAIALLLEIGQMRVHCEGKVDRSETVVLRGLDL